MTEVAGIFQTLERNACFDWWEESLFYKYEGQAVARYELEDQGTLTWTILITTAFIPRVPISRRTSKKMLIPWMTWIKAKL